VLLLGLGLLLLALALQQWRGRPTADEEPSMPGWMRTINDFTTVKAGGAGIVLTALNPKNVLLTVAAAAEIAEAGLPAGRQIVVMVGFVLFASAGVLAPVMLSVTLGDRSHELLDGLKGWLARHNAAIMTVLFLLIGTKLIGDAVTGFSG
jgi:threonine/homoserine/homoserine lactone efflux protein